MVFAKHRELGERVGGNYANLLMQVLRTLLYFAMDHYEAADGRQIIPENPVSRISKNQMWYRKRRRQGMIADHQLSDRYVMATQSEHEKPLGARTAVRAFQCRARRLPEMCSRRS